MKTYIEIEVDIEFDYTKEEPATMIDPPVYAAVEITSVKLEGLEIFEHITGEHIGQINEAAWEEVHTPPDPPEPDW